MALWESVLGIALAMVATVCFNYAPILQKSAVDSLEAISITKNLKQSLKGMFSNRRWLLGGAIAMLGGIPYTVALVLVGITVLQPLMSFGFIVLVYFGTKQLGEHVGPKEGTGILLMIGMPVLLFFADVTNVQADLLAPAPQLALVVFSIVCCVLVAGFLLFDKLVQRPWAGGLAWALATGTCFAEGVTMGQAALGFLEAGSVDIVADFWRLGPLFFQGNACVVLAAACGLLCLVFNMVGGFFMQIAFQKGDATRVGPLNQSINVFLSVTGGIVIFGQVVGRVPFYGLALVATFVGTYLLGKFQAVTQAETRMDPGTQTGIMPGREGADAEPGRPASSPDKLDRGGA